MTRTQEGLLEGAHAVLTPEYVEFRFALAGLYSRFLAWLLDAVLVFCIYLALAMLLANALPAFPGIRSAIGVLIYFLLDWFYAMALETIWSGQTVGKRVLGIRAIQESGVRIGFIQAALRNLARAIDRLPFFYLVGGVTALANGSQQRLGDLLAGTIVVRDRRQKLPSSLERPAAEKALLQDPAFAVRVKQLTAEEQDVVLSAAMRREELTVEARLKLFHALSEHLLDRGFFKPEHLSDEKLVLLVAAALAEKAPKPRANHPRTANP